MSAVLKVTAAVVVTVAVLLSLAWALQRRLIYFPDRGPVPPAGSVLPGAQDVAFRTEDGLELAGWYVPAAGTGPRATVLVLNGNAGDRSARAPLAAALARIRDVRSPVVVVAGSADDIVPAALSRRLHDAAPGSRRYVEVPGAGHNDLVLLAGEQLVREVVAATP